MRYIEVFDINPNYIVRFKVYNIGPIYIYIVGLVFLYFGYEGLYLRDQLLDMFNGVNYI